MGEPWRIDTKHVGPPINKKEERKNEPTYRFEIGLHESTTDDYPEISLADLVEDRKKSEAPPDPGDVNMKELEAIAKRMEEKYGGGSKRKSRVEDFCDLGEGYDENDSFIDNSEEYDELVPSYLTTKLGGFFINSGSLELKEESYSASADGSVDDYSSSAEDTEGDQEQQKKLLSGNSAVLGRPKKQKNKIMVEGEIEKRKRFEAVSDLVAQKYEAVIDDVVNQGMQDKLSKLPGGLPESFISQIDLLEKIADNSSDENQKLFSADVNQMLLRLATDSRHLSGSQRKAVYTYLACFLPVGRETLMKRIKMLTLKEEDSKLHAPSERLKQAIEQAMPSVMDKYHSYSAAAAQARLESKIMVEGEIEKSKRCEAISDLDAQKCDAVIDDVVNQGMQDKLSKLPGGLPESFISQIDLLEKIVNCSSDENQKLFSADVNQMLLRLATDSRHLSGSQRKAVFTYLACFLPVGRETLMKRIKMLTLKEEDSKLHAPSERLKQGSPDSGDVHMKEVEAIAR